MMTARKLKPVISDFLNKFHERRMDVLRKLTLAQLVCKKNPYMYRVIVGDDCRKLVAKMLADRISSSTEGIFGGSFVEALALKCSGGMKHGAPGSDIYFTRRGIRYVVAIKSGTASFNSSSWAAQEASFLTIKRSFRTNHTSVGRERYKDAKYVVGYFYGHKVTKHDWIEQYAGQDFWTFLSDGNTELYSEIMDMVGALNGKYVGRYERLEREVRKRLTEDFRNAFGNTKGKVNWNLLVEYVSGSRPASVAKGGRKGPVRLDRAA